MIKRFFFFFKKKKNWERHGGLGGFTFTQATTLYLPQLA